MGPSAAVAPGLGESLTVARIEHLLRGHCVVVDDVRMENEAALLRSMGASILQIFDPAAALGSEGGRITAARVRAD